MASASCQKTWTVVFFLDEDSVEAVPTSWISGELCYYPVATKKKNTSSISKNDPVNFDWPSHKIRTFLNGTYESYSLARQKARVAEKTSDLSSDADKKIKMSATQKDCEKAIVAWLKRAKEREERDTKKF
ncbi:unnamed protein product [Brassicogethes aeneus]|uniref:Uncharacterized protein n=1 Tax=Brassicogethes aeneus TaxID=1431903 RepID=A0A9P0BH76_BRAAE|nr:unnamed protein product [Brassicogethes aeneus]